MTPGIITAHINQISATHQQQLNFETVFQLSQMKILNLASLTLPQLRRLRALVLDHIRFHAIPFTTGLSAAELGFLHDHRPYYSGLSQYIRHRLDNFTAEEANNIVQNTYILAQPQQNLGALNNNANAWLNHMEQQNLQAPAVQQGPIPVNNLHVDTLLSFVPDFVRDCPNFIEGHLKPLNIIYKMFSSRVREAANINIRELLTTTYQQYVNTVVNPTVGPDTLFNPLPASIDQMDVAREQIPVILKYGAHILDGPSGQRFWEMLKNNLIALELPDNWLRDNLLGAFVRQGDGEINQGLIRWTLNRTFVHTDPATQFDQKIDFLQKAAHKSIALQDPIANKIRVFVDLIATTAIDGGPQGLELVRAALEGGMVG